MPTTSFGPFGEYLNEAYEVTPSPDRLRINILEKGVIRTEGEVYLTILQRDVENFYGSKRYAVETLKTYTHQIVMKVTGPEETLKITLDEAPRHSATYEVEKLK